MLRRKPDSLRANLQHLQQLLHVEDDKLSRLVRQYPAVICYSPQTLEQKVLGLQEALNITAEQVASLCRTTPAMLTRDTQSLVSNALQLQVLLGVQQSVLTEILLSNPSLMAVQPDTLRKKWNMLVACGSCHSQWAKALAAYSPATLARMLVSGTTRYTRLQYLLSVVLQGSTDSLTQLSIAEGDCTDGVSRGGGHGQYDALPSGGVEGDAADAGPQLPSLMMVLTKTSDDAFNEMHPGFAAWYADRWADDV